MLAGDLQPLETALSDEYRFVRELGRGGWGVVYLADDLAHERQVAVKILQLEVDAPRARDRFLREIDIVRHLNHPNILPILDSGERAGSLYYVMPFVNGETLQQRLRRERQLPIGEAVRIAREIAVALGHAHVVGVIHRDVKPANILLEGSRVLVADFGIARAIPQSGPEQWVTSANSQIGTPEYMSVEQASGDVIDGRADLYALGCVLYEMLTGSPPFTGSTTAAVMSRHAFDPVPSLRTVRPSAPVAVEQIALRALAKVPADRFATAEEMAAALEVAPLRATESPAAARSATIPVRQAGGWSRARLLWLGAGAVGLVAGATWLFNRTPPTAGAGSVPHDLSLVQPAVDSTLGRPTGTELGAALRDALAEWRDVRVRLVPALSASAAAAQSAGVGMTDALGSQSYVTAQLERRADAAVLTVRRISLEGDRPVYDGQLRQLTTPAQAPELSIRLARRLFAPAESADTAYESGVRVSHLVAWREYQLGRQALNRWKTTDAARHFARATAASEDFAAASLWSIQLNALANPLEDSASWLERARHANRFAPSLRGRDSIIARALGDVATGNIPGAQVLLKGLIATDSADGVAWVDLAIATGRDSIVIRDRRSSTGWRFRSSHAEANALFMRAIHLEPRIRHVLPASQVASLLIYRPAGIRVGRGELSDTLRFYALPSLDRDSVVLLPVPRGEFVRGAVPATVAQAVAANQRKLTADLTEWIRGDSTSSDAYRILSELLEVRGDVSGPDVGSSAELALAKAMAFAPTEARKFDLRVARLRLLLKLGRFAQVRDSARQLLADARRTGGRSPRQLRGVAALIGDVQATADYEFQISRIRGSESPAVGDPAPLAHAYSAFYAAATVGPCTPTVNAMLDSLVAAVDGYVAPNERTAALRRLAATGVGFAVPCIGAARSAALATDATPAHRLISAVSRADRASVQRELTAVRQSRVGARPADVTPDVALVEAWLILQGGDTAAAVTKLDTQILPLTTLTPRLLDQASTAGAIGRAMLLRSTLARDHAAQPSRWAAAAEALLGISSRSARGLER